MSNSLSDPLRPDDHADGAPRTGRPTGDIAQPRLGVVGWLRWGWRQLTSMRTALVLLLLLAIAAIPGSIVPQRTADPNGVSQYRTDNPDLYPILDHLQLFDVYSSAWFSAIYILLFISLIGCVIPRTTHHFKALRARPPRTPVRLSRLDDHAETVRAVPAGTDASDEASHAVDLAQQQLRKAGYRVERYDTPATAKRPAVASVAVVAVAVAALVAIAIAVTIPIPVAIVAAGVATVGVARALALVDTLLIVPGAVVAAICLGARATVARGGLVAIGLAAARVRGFVGQRGAGEEGACQRHCQHGHGFRAHLRHRAFSLCCRAGPDRGGTSPV